jgi:thioredoxin 1
MQGPIVEKVAEAVGTRAVIAKVNVDENRATAGRFEVSSIPTLIVFKDGKPVKRFVGVQSLNTLVQAVEAAGKP